MRSVLTAALLLAGSGCSLILPLEGYTFGDAEDASVTRDAGLDAAATDAGETDAGDGGTPPDAGRDAGETDAGAQPAVIEISLGDNHACARLEDGSLRCWGDNQYGQIGDGTFTDRTTPTAASLADVAEIDIGYGSSCARLADGTVSCWGQNDRGQVGDGTFTNRPLPTPVSGLADVVDVDAAWSYACAADDLGATYCWGSHQFYNLGPDATDDSPTPLEITGASGAVQISMLGMKCFLDGSRDVYCWGTNVGGRLGDGTETDRPNPVRVLVESGQAAEVTAGGFNACVRMLSGRVFCFGGFDGVARPDPFDVGVSGAAQVSSGNDHVCLIRQPGGQVMCFGLNDSGELGTGTTASESVPTLVSLPRPATQVAAGRFFTCAVLDDGRLFCWGSNAEGQLGIGNRDNQLSPVEVMF